MNYNVWDNGFDSKEGIIDQFEIKGSDADDLLKSNVIFAQYTGGGYDGDAQVIYEHNGTLYEVRGGHCSCYGLEGQWQPEVVTLEQLKMRKDSGYTEGTSNATIAKIVSDWLEENNK